MNRGYIKLWRKTLDTEILKNHKLWAFWSWCLMKASHKRYTQLIGFQEIELFPGQFIFGRSVAAKDLAMSVQNIRTCVQYLSKHKNLTIKSTNKFSIITIVNWGTYQQQDEENNQQDNKQLTSKQPATNQQVTTNKNVENGKNGKNNTPPTPSQGGDAVSPPDEKKPTRAKKIPDDFSITAGMIDWFKKQNFGIDIAKATEEFIDHWRGTGKPMKDWEATWRNSMRKQNQWAGNGKRYPVNDCQPSTCPPTIKGGEDLYK